MIDLKLEHKPFFFVGAAMLGAEVVYVSSLASGPQSGWFVYFCLLALAISTPMLVGACLGYMVGYQEPARSFLYGGLIFGILWFVFALAALSKLAALILVCVGVVFYKKLQSHHKYSKGLSDPAQQGAQADGSN